MKSCFCVFIILFSLACSSRPQPINPANGKDVTQNVEELTHEQKVNIQEEMIDRQEREKARQERDYLRLKQQQHYNLMSERFKGDNSQ